MGLFIRRLFWLILVLSSGVVAALIAAKQYGIKIDLNYWAKISGLNEVSGVTEVINKIPVLLDYPIVKSYGFYGSLGLFLILLLIFTISLRSKSDEETEVIRSEKIKADLDTDTVPIKVNKAPDKLDDVADSIDEAPQSVEQPDSFSETFDGSDTASQFVAETNSDAVVGTDGNVYDGTATFSGTDTYSHIDSRSQFDTSTDVDDETDDEVEDDIPEQSPISAADDRETGLSHLTDAELKRETLDLVEEIRAFETDYQDSRDETMTELTDFSNPENLEGALQDVKDTYEKKQAAFSSAFEDKYRPEGVAVRHEISKRLGISEPYNNFNPALDKGMLVGISPLSDAADVIEDLVKKLA